MTLFPTHLNREPMDSSERGVEQLDQLLLKAGTYSRFILENQERPAKRQRAEKGDNAVVFPQPPNLSGGQLLPHQLEGLQWLLSLWENGLNGILADEMGLGKTIQIISLIAHLRHHQTAGPYLIAAPLATILNWRKEFQKWLPSCPVLLYYGNKSEREHIRRNTMHVHDQKSMSFPVVITSFETCMSDRGFLERFTWQYIIIDEGHRIKNRNCKLLKDLKSIRSISRLLLTGTPIQNSLEELWSLLNFCSPQIFDDLEVFQSWFDFKKIGEQTRVEDILDEEQNNRIVTKLHDILRPFVLRRLKRDTIGDLLLPKKEIVVYCGMSRLQRQYYDWTSDDILRDQLIAAQVPHAKKISQINKIMNFRKICNHPFLFGDITDQTITHEATRQDKYIEALVASSGKFKLLDRMLSKLRNARHKVIIFSQMTELMNLLNEFFESRKYSYVRFDGSTKLAERQEAIDNFNDPNSDVFIFLISTRAGGLGINLTSADTVIIFDSDWNPHVDSQAQDRCHRIGQKKHVVIYRLLTPHSVEMEMMRKQLSKKKLERLTINSGDFRKAGKRQSKMFSVDDLRCILQDDVNIGRKYGVEPQTEDISEEELDLILNRSRLFDSSLQSQETEMSADDAEDFDGDLDSMCDCSVPLEGDMYDIVQSDSAGLLQGIS